MRLPQHQKHIAQSPRQMLMQTHASLTEIPLLLGIRVGNFGAATAVGVGIFSTFWLHYLLASPKSWLAGLLLANLSVYNGCEILFDSQEVPKRSGDAQRPMSLEVRLELALLADCRCLCAAVNILQRDIPCRGHLLLICWIVCHSFDGFFLQHPDISSETCALFMLCYMVT